MLRCAMLCHMSAEFCVLKVDLKPCDAILRHAMPRQAMLCHAMLCHAMLCHAMTSCHAMLCHAMLSQVKSSQVKSSQVKSSQVKSSQAKPSQAKPSQAKPSQAKPSQAKPCHAMPCHAMPRHAMPCYAMLCYPSSQICIPEVDLEPVREELLVAVGAGHLVRQAVLAELVLDDAVGGQHNVSLLQFVNACLPLVAMIHNHLQEQS